MRSLNLGDFCFQKIHFHALKKGISDVMGTPLNCSKFGWKINVGARVAQFCHIFCFDDKTIFGPHLRVRHFWTWRDLNPINFPAIFRIVFGQVRVQLTPEKGKYKISPISSIVLLFEISFVSGWWKIGMTKINHLNLSNKSVGSSFTTTWNLAASLETRLKLVMVWTATWRCLCFVSSAIKFISHSSTVCLTINTSFMY